MLTSPIFTRHVERNVGNIKSSVSLSVLLLFIKQFNTSKEGREEVEEEGGGM